MRLARSGRTVCPFQQYRSVILGRAQRSAVTLATCAVLGMLFATADVLAADGRTLITQAYERTKSAATLADYEAILDLCEQAQSSGLSQSQEDYVKSLQSWAHNRRGEVYTEQASGAQERGDKQEAATLDAKALADFETAIQLDPSRWKPWHNRGVSYAVTGKYQQAISDFTRVIELNPGYANAWFNRGEIRFEMGQLNDALKDYSQAIELESSDAGAYRSRGHTYFRLGKYKEALADYAQAVQLAPDDPIALVDRGDAYQSLGQWREAAADFNQAIELAPESPRVLQSAAWLMATCPDESIRDAKLAVQAAEKAVELLEDPGALYLDTLAAAYASAGRFDDAVAKLKEAIPRATSEQAANFQKRLALYQQKQPYRQSAASTGTAANGASMPASKPNQPKSQRKG